MYATAQSNLKGMISSSESHSSNKMPINTLSQILVLFSKSGSPPHNLISHAVQRQLNKTKKNQVFSLQPMKPQLLPHISSIFLLGSYNCYVYCKTRILLHQGSTPSSIFFFELTSHSPIFLNIRQPF